MRRRKFLAHVGSSFGLGVLSPSLFLKAHASNFATPNQFPVHHVISGANNDEGFTVTAVWDGVPVDDVTVAISLQPDPEQFFASVRLSPLQVLRSNQRLGNDESVNGRGENPTGEQWIVKHTFTGLQPDTVYYVYFAPQLSVDTENHITTHTFPSPLTPKDFTLLTGSCSNNQNNNGPDRGEELYDAMASENAYLFLHTGDMCYTEAGVSPGTDEEYKGRLRTGMSRYFHRGGNLLSKVTPLAYIWDDHDSFGNDSDIRKFPTFTTVTPLLRDVNLERIPHWPLAQQATDPAYTQGLTQVFPVGRVLFIKPDMRSFLWTAEPDPVDTYDDYSPMTQGTAFGDGRNLGGAQTWDQISWLKQTLLQAKQDGYLLCVIAASINLNEVRENIGDGQGLGHLSFSTKTIAGIELLGLHHWMANNDIPEVLWIQGDSHYFHASDGSLGARDASDGEGLFPLFCMANLHPGGSQPGADWRDHWNRANTIGPGNDVEPAEYGHIIFTDDGDRIHYIAEDRGQSGHTVMGPYSNYDRVPTVTIPATPLYLPETAGTFTLRLGRSWFGPSLYRVVTSDGTALAGTDYTAINQVIEVNAHQRELRIPVDVVDRNNTGAPNRYLEITLTPLNNHSAVDATHGSKVRVEIVNGEDTYLHPVIDEGVDRLLSDWQKQNDPPERNLSINTQLYKWRVSNKRARFVAHEILNGGQPEGGPMNLVHPDGVGQDFIYTCRIHHMNYLANDGWQGVVFRWRDEYHFSRFMFSPLLNQWLLEMAYGTPIDAVLDNTHTIQIASGAMPPDYFEGDYGLLRIECLGNNIKISIDGNQIVDIDEPRANPSGVIGISAFAQTHGYFGEPLCIHHPDSDLHRDNIMVNVVSPNPTFGANAFENSINWNPATGGIPPNWRTDERRFEQMIATPNNNSALDPNVCGSAAVYNPGTPPAVPVLNWTDYEVSCVIGRSGGGGVTPNGDRHVGIWFRAQPSGRSVLTSNKQQEYYRLRWDDSFLHLEAVTGASGTTSVVTSLATPVAKARDFNRDYQFKVQVVGNTIKAWIDGALMFDTVDPANTHPSGTVAFYNARVANTVYYNLNVTLL